MTIWVRGTGPAGAVSTSTHTFSSLAPDGTGYLCMYLAQSCPPCGPGYTCGVRGCQPIDVELADAPDPDCAPAEDGGPQLEGDGGTPGESGAGAGAAQGDAARGHVDGGVVDGGVVDGGERQTQPAQAILPFVPAVPTSTARVEILDGEIDTTAFWTSFPLPPGGFTKVILSDGRPVAVLAVTSLNIAGRLRVHGALPLSVAWCFSSTRWASRSNAFVASRRSSPPREQIVGELTRRLLRELPATGGFELQQAQSLVDDPMVVGHSILVAYPRRRRLHLRGWHLQSIGASVEERAHRR